MFSFFKKKKSKIDVPYDTKLIKKFHKDHEKLIKTVTKISNAMEEGDTKKVKSLLSQLKTELLGHFMEEDIKLYRYLKKYYVEEDDITKTITMFEESIKDIQKDVVSFLDHYTKENTPLDKKFDEQFNAIVNALGTRIRTEENNLYTLYIH
jgi:iron-sulfur cluster repair protein YtfE (RIC family)